MAFCFLTVDRGQGRKTPQAPGFCGSARPVEGRWLVAKGWFYGFATPAAATCPMARAMMVSGEAGRRWVVGREGRRALVIGEASPAVISGAIQCPEVV